jgi:hypothetical protein
MKPLLVDDAFRQINDIDLPQQPPAHQKVEVYARSTKIISAVTIFNMALACHRQFQLTQQKDCRKGDLLLKRANFLYNQSYQLLEECWIAPQESVFQLIMTIANSMIEIALAYGAMDEVQEWKAKLTATLALADDSCMDVAVRGYFIRVIVLYTGSFVGARAA